MREIKFRAWFGDRMKAVKELQFHENDNITIVGEDDGMFFLKPDGKPYLLEYTGLKDKNGVEIYEGDIVMTHGKMYGDVPMEVKWFLDDDLVGFNLNNDPAALYEVIGNIYENRELLK